MPKILRQYFSLRLKVKSGCQHSPPQVLIFLQLKNNRWDPETIEIPLCELKSPLSSLDSIEKKVYPVKLEEPWVPVLYLTPLAWCLRSTYVRLFDLLTRRNLWVYFPWGKMAFGVLEKALVDLLGFSWLHIHPPTHLLIHSFTYLPIFPTICLTPQPFSSHLFSLPGSKSRSCSDARR